MGRPGSGGGPHDLAPPLLDGIHGHEAPSKGPLSKTSTRSGAMSSTRKETGSATVPSGSRDSSKEARVPTELVHHRQAPEPTAGVLHVGHEVHAPPLVGGAQWYKPPPN